MNGQQVFLVESADGRPLGIVASEAELNAWLDQDGGRRRNPRTRDDMVGISVVRIGADFLGQPRRALNPRTLKPVL